MKLRSLSLSSSLLLLSYRILISKLFPTTVKSTDVESIQTDHHYCGIPAQSVTIWACIFTTTQSPMQSSTKQINILLLHSSVNRRLTDESPYSSISCQVCSCSNLLNIWEFVYFVWRLCPPKRPTSSKFCKQTRTDHVQNSCCVLCL